MKSLKRYLHIVVISVSLCCLTIACFDEIKSPVLPKWDVEYFIPLLNKTEIIKDRIKGEKGIFIDSTTQELLLKFDSTEVKTQSLEKFFANNISFDENFTVKTNRVDTLTFSSYIVDDSVYIDQMKLFKGKLEFKVKNYLNKTVNVYFVVVNFSKNVSGRIDTLNTNMIIAGNSTSTKSVDLSNYVFNKLTASPISGTPGNGIYIKGFIKTVSGYEGDSIVVNMKLDSLGFSFVKGRFKPYETEIKSKTNKLEVSDDARDILPKINVYGAKIIFTPNTNIQDLELRLKNFQVVGTFKNSTQKKYLKINNRTVLDTIISLGQSKIEFNLDDFAINDFISPTIPDSITYSGDVIINPNYKSFSASFPDTIKFNSRILIYSIFKIDNASKTDTLDLNLTDDDKKTFDNFNYANLELFIENHIPIGFKVNGYFIDERNNKLFYFTRERGDGSPSDTTLNIQASIINSEGLTVQSSKQNKKIIISKDDLSKIKLAKKAILKVVLYSSDGKKVKLSANDRIHFRASLQFKAKLDF